MTWSHLHIITLIPSLIIMFIISIILRKHLIDKSIEKRMIPLKIISLILVIGEIAKQIFSLKNGYNLFCLPFHVCSLFVFCLPLMAFYKGKYSPFIKSLTTTLCTLLFLCIIIMPDQIYSEANIINFFNYFLSFHTVVFHNLVVFAFMLILSLDLYNKEDFTKYSSIFIFGCIYVLVASSAAQLLKTNFSNFYVCQVELLQNISNYFAINLGPIFGRIAHVIMVGATHVAGFIVSYFLTKIIITIKDKNDNYTI